MHGAEDMKSQDILLEFFPQGALLFRLGDLRLLEFNQVGADILRRLEAGKGCEEIVCSLARFYDVEPQEIRPDVRSFLERMEGSGISPAELQKNPGLIHTSNKGA